MGLLRELRRPLNTCKTRIGKVSIFRETLSFIHRGVQDGMQQRVSELGDKSRRASRVVERAEAFIELWLVQSCFTRVTRAAHV